MKTTIGDRLYSFTLISAFLLTVIFHVQGDREEASRKFRTSYELCTEVTREVNIQVGEGMLTQEQADAISTRCFELYAEDQ